MAFHPLLLASLSASQHNTPDKIRTGQGRAADIITFYFSPKSPSEKMGFYDKLLVSSKCVSVLVVIVRYV